MIINHTSPNQIKTVKRSGHNPEVEFSGCLFFSDDIYTMTMGTATHHYTINVNDTDCIHVSDLEDVDLDDSSALEMIVHYGQALGFDLDEDLAYELLDCSSTAWDHFQGEDVCFLDWYVQGIQGRVARQMGFVACESEDEQGTVYIVDMYNRENLLKYEGEI